MSTENRKALVTGGTSGIGRAVAERLAHDGLEVIISGRNEQRGEEVVAAIAADGGTARFVRADLSSIAEVRQLAEAAREVDVLVNDAGLFPAGPTHEITEESFDETFEVNVKAPFFLTAAIAPEMARRGGGSIINVSTMVASYGLAGMALYGASKAALELLTKAWADEYGPQGVRVNAVAPGPTRTPLTEPMGSALDDMASGTPARRTADPAEIAAAVAFLASEEASYVYGVVLPTDGGRVAV